jgi:hypothetical protein
VTRYQTFLLAGVGRELRDSSKPGRDDHPLGEDALGDMLKQRSGDK